MSNPPLTDAKRAKRDKFYTQFADIEAEVLAYDPATFRGKTVLLPCDDPEWSNFTKFFTLNFHQLGLKKLISTNYAPGKNGRISIFTGGEPQWYHLKGDGDFRSDEVTRLRDEADIIVTNPPFSLFREFLAWLVSANKKFLVLGTINAATYKEVFPLIKENRVWLGATITSGGREFQIPNNYPLAVAGRIEGGKQFVQVEGVRWFTNLEHRRRHIPLDLMSEKEVAAGMNAPFQTYDNYGAIEVPKTAWIPADHNGVMGVPVSFLDKYCPEQFEILGITDRGNAWGLKTKEYTTRDSPAPGNLNRRAAIKVGDTYKATYARLLIRRL